MSWRKKGGRSLEDNRDRSGWIPFSPPGFRGTRREIGGLHQPFRRQAKDEVSCQTARVGLPGKGPRPGREPEDRVAGLVEQQPDRRAEESAQSQVPSQPPAGQPAAQQSMEGARADANGPMDGRSQLFALLLRELPAGETGGLLRGGAFQRQSSVENIDRIEFDIVFLQQRDQLFLEGLSPVVRFLSPNVRAYRALLRFADGERRVTGLPGEIRTEAFLVVNPLRGTSLHVPHQLRNRDVRLEAEQDVDVVRHAVQGQEPSLLPADDPLDVGVKLRAQLWIDERSPRFGAEDHVIQEPGEGSSHRDLYPPEVICREDRQGQDG